MLGVSQTFFKETGLVIPEGEVTDLTAEEMLLAFNIVLGLENFGPTFSMSDSQKGYYEVYRNENQRNIEHSMRNSRKEPTYLGGYQSY